MKKNVKEVERLIEIKLDSFAYPDGIRHYCDKREIETISVVGSKFKQDLIELNKKSDLTFEEIEKYYYAMMNSMFGEKIIEKAEKAYDRSWGYEKEEIENFIVEMNESMEYGKKAVPECKKMIEDAKQGKKANIKR